MYEWEILIVLLVPGGTSDHNSPWFMSIQGKQLWPFTPLKIQLTSELKLCANYIVISLLLPFLCRPIDGISTYNVVPFEAGAYFNKIQCFCFEEQRLNPGEEVGWTKPSKLIQTHPYIAGWYARLLLHWPRLCRGSVYAEHKWNNIELYFLWIEAGAPAPDLQSQCWKIADLEFESVNLL